MNRCENCGRVGHVKCGYEKEQALRRAAGLPTGKEVEAAASGGSTNSFLPPHARPPSLQRPANFLPAHARPRPEGGADDEDDTAAPVVEKAHGHGHGQGHDDKTPTDKKKK